MTHTSETPSATELPNCPSVEQFRKRHAAGEYVTDLLRSSAEFTAHVEAENPALVLGDK
jgi:hypothetical protein